jgi:crossover junction endodeoxyribonuclease RuvC
MFEDDELVLGVDPGSTAVGLALVRRAKGPGAPSVEWAGTLHNPPTAGPGERLLRIYRGVREAIEKGRPGALALEQLIWGRNTRSAMEVARASGAIILAAAEAGVQVEEYAPLEVKIAVTGVGNAAKPAVRRGLIRLVGVNAVPDDPDAADAVAVAVCHLQESRMRRVAREAAR